MAEITRYLPAVTKSPLGDCQGRRNHDITKRERILRINKMLNHPQ